MSWLSRVGASAGLKKSCACRVPSDCGCSRMTDSASWPGGLLPGPLGGEMPLPEVRMIRLGPSDTIPPPLCQMPAESSVAPASSDHSEALPFDTFTADTYPSYGLWSQCEENAA